MLLAMSAGALLPWAAAHAADAIRIGGLAPLSPPGGVQTGESLRDGMKVAVEELNAKGGLLGQPVELIVEDTSGVPEKGVAAFERLASKENVVAVTGSAHSAPRASAARTRAASSGVGARSPVATMGARSLMRARR